MEPEPDVNWLLQQQVLNNLAVLEEEGLTYDLLILPKHFEVAETVVKKFPKLQLVIDHLAKPNMRQEDFEGWAVGTEHLAQHSNVFCKLSGLSDRVDDPHSSQGLFSKYILKAVELFESNRCMFGSDWPVCLMGWSWQHWYQTVKTAIEHLPQSDKENIMSKTARKFYKLDNLI